MLAFRVVKDVAFTLGFCLLRLIIPNRLWQLGSRGCGSQPFGTGKGHVGKTVAFLYMNNVMHSSARICQQRGLVDLQPRMGNSSARPLTCPPLAVAAGCFQTPFVQDWRRLADVSVCWVWPDKEFITKHRIIWERNEYVQRELSFFFRR